MNAEFEQQILALLETALIKTQNEHRVWYATQFGIAHDELL
jgi:hypothetical protein